MIATVHFLIGILIGKSLSSIPLIMILALVSHFILDAIPHIDQGSFKLRKSDWKKRDWFLVFIDVLVGASVALYFALNFNFLNILIGVIFAILPDVIGFSSRLLNIDKKPVLKQFNQFASSIAFKMTKDLIWLGIILEMVITLAILGVLFS